MSADPYTILGVDKGADPDEVKRAYRRKVKKAHPDAGGSDAEAAAVNDAYAALADPERRAQYDATGQTGAVRSIEDEAADMLMLMFAAALDAGKGQFIKTVQSKLAHMSATGSGSLSSLKVRIRKLENRRATVKGPKDGRNLAHMVIDQQLDGLRQEQERIGRSMEVLKAVEGMLKAYACDEVDPAPRGTWGGFPVGMLDGVGRVRL